MPQQVAPTVLVVDADAAVAAALVAAGATRPRPWCLQHVTERKPALELLQQHTFDVVVSDLALPDGSGIELLAAARDLQPHAVRIALAREGHEGALLQAIPHAHQWLQRPIEAHLLGTAVERALKSRSFVHRDDLQAVLGNARLLPALPRLFAEITQRIADPQTDAAGVATILQRDPAIAVKVLQLANGTLPPASRPLPSIAAAVDRIGLRQLANCVLAAELFAGTPVDTRAPGPLLAEIEAEAMARARLLTLWTEDAALDAELCDLLPTAGLLHEVGSLVLLEFDALSFRTARRMAQRQRGAVERFEQRLLCTDHARVAGSILGAWGLPWPLVELLAHHHDADRCLAPGDPCAMLHTADVLVAAPWRLPELEEQAHKNGWPAQLAHWLAAGRDLLAI